MNRYELIERVAEEGDVSKTEADKLVRIVFDTIVDTLKNGEKVGISGFGVYSVTERAARVGRNPKTGESIEIPPSKSVKFRQGKSLRESVN